MAVFIAPLSADFSGARASRMPARKKTHVRVRFSVHAKDSLCIGSPSNATRHTHPSHWCSAATAATIWPTNSTAATHVSF